MLQPPLHKVTLRYSFRLLSSTTSLRAALAGALLPLLLAACQAPEPTTNDTADDTAADTADDTAADTADDTAADTADDTAADTADDTAADTADDTAADTADDTAADAGGGTPNGCGGTATLPASPGEACNSCGAVWTCDGLDNLVCSGGTVPCIDDCPLDPAKTDPGICGCGVADTDLDGDALMDCMDGCPEDPAKFEPQTCGCGVAETDSDADGSPDCVDSCPADPNKSSAGACGCGIAETDGDLDGTPNCVDACPLDASKTLAGACGCGIADTDSDADGIANCNDGCPADRAKSAPGICGCGIADTDSDSDGTANCNDGCPSDAAKTEGGICGCGTADDDSDADGTLDCLDACPADPTLTSEGLCGCGPEIFLPATPTLIQPIVSPGVTLGTTAQPPSYDENQLSCSTGAGAPDNTFLVQFPTGGTWCIDTLGSTNFDTVLGLFSCGAELACSDDAIGLQSQLEVSVDAIGSDLSGPTYQLVVDGYDATTAGSFQLNIQPGACRPFATVEDCATPGDEDRNGLADCADAAACADSCACDVDGDSVVGCLDACDFDAAKSEVGACGCGSLEPRGIDAVAVLHGAGTVTGSTADAVDSVAPSCAVSGAADNAIDFTATASGRWCFSTADSLFDTVLWSESCFRELNCNDDSAVLQTTQSTLELNLTAGASVRLFVSGYETQAGSYRLTASRGACGPISEVCSNNIDDDGDGDADCADADCVRETAVGDACLKTATTVRTGSLTYEHIAPTPDFTDWGAAEDRPAAGMLVASYRGAQLLDTAIVGSTGSFSIAVPTTPITGDQIVYWAVAERLGQANLVVASPDLAAGEQPAGDTGASPYVWKWSLNTADFVASSSRRITDAIGSGMIQTFLQASAAYLRGESVLYTPTPIVIWAAPGVSWDCGACAWKSSTSVLGLNPWPLFGQQVVMPDDADHGVRSDAVTAHELGHSVMNAFGTSPRESGTHYVGSTVQPGMAWSEGWASYLSTSVRGSTIYYDKQGGGFFWVDIGTRTYSGHDWIRPSSTLPLDQAIDENEVAAMTWGLEKKSGWTSILRMLASERMNMPVTPRGYTRRTWDDPRDPLNYVDTGVPSRHFADALDAMLCNNLIAPTALWSVTEPWGFYPYYDADSPLCF